MNKTAKNLIVFVAVLTLTLTVGAKSVFADCESTYGGGENCTYNKRFQINKYVRIGGTDEWKSKVTDVSKNDIVEFKVTIKNRSDEETGNFDDMRMEDYLPSELHQVGGDDLIKEWDNFDAGESKTFIIKAQIDSGEFNRKDNFEKCVVNKAKVKWNGNFEGSDTATVCYGRGKPSELPATGAVSDLAILGLGFVTAGALVKLVKKFTTRKLTK